MVFTPKLHPRGPGGRFIPVGYGLGKGRKVKLNKYTVGSGGVGGARHQARGLQAQIRLSDKAGRHVSPMRRDVSHWASGSRRRGRVDVFTRVVHRRVPALRGTRLAPLVVRVRRKRAAPRRKK